MTSTTASLLGMDDGELSSPASSPSPLTPPNILTQHHPSPASTTSSKPPPHLSLPESVQLTPINTSSTMSQHTTTTPIKNRNKNDIFNAPSPILTPAPKLPSLKPPQAHSTTPLNTNITLPALPSLPSFTAAGRPPTLRISTDSSSSSSSSIADPAFWAQPLPLHPSSSSIADNDPPTSLPLSGRARSPPVSTLDIRIRLILSGQYLLGIGSHSDVYLGSYRFRSSPSRTTATTTRRWHLCAIKRLHPDRESLLLGLDEVFVLRRLGPHPNVVRLIDVRDEVDLVPERGAGGTQLLSTKLPLGRRRFVSSSAAAGEAISSGGQQHPLSAVLRANPATPVEQRITSLSASSSLVPLGMRSIKGLNSRLPVDMEAESPMRSSVGATRPSSGFLAAPAQRTRGSGHGRSTSDTYGERSPTPPSGRSAVPVPDPTAENPRPLASTNDSVLSSQQSANTDPPRMLLLLELLPYQLSTYARLHPHRVTYTQWRLWALQLLSALSFFHARNLAHADIKKENCLLTEDLVLKVGDLGSARWMDVGGSGGGGGGLGLGTLAYSAPELAKVGEGRRGRGQGGEEGVFGVKVDIWSAGAVLYSLAIDQPPFSRARSTIDILNRKRNFFQTEEQDRTSRFDVEVGMSSISSRPGSRASNLGGASPGPGAGGGSGSRHGSLRGRKGVHSRTSSENLMGGVAVPGSETKQVQLSALGLGNPPTSSSSSSQLSSSATSGGGGGGGHSHSYSYPSLLLRHGPGYGGGRKERERERDSSTDSVDSLASSIQNMDGRSPSALAVAALLADDEEVEAEKEQEQEQEQDVEMEMGEEAKTTPSTVLGFLAAPGEAAGRGRGWKVGGDSSPLRKGTAALLSHSQSRRCPSVKVDGVVVGEKSPLAVRGSPGAGVRRTPSMPFRAGAGAGVGTNVARHHSVKVHSQGGLGLGIDTSSAQEAVAAANRMRATSVGAGAGAGAGVGSGLPAVINASSSSGMALTTPRPDEARTTFRRQEEEAEEDDFFYAPPTPIAEMGEGEGEESRSPMMFDSFGRSSMQGRKPSISRGYSYRGRSSSTTRTKSTATMRTGTGTGVGGGHARKAPSISSLSSASTAGSYPPSESDDEDEEHRSNGEEEEEEEEQRPYASDGAPSIVLPGGGRLPDAARDLLRAMLETDPRRRPSAVEVLAVLERL
ncbi:hypothetical protein CF327_g4466 [Tilletia walkeri]|nr:hypothetical protein CF327_g4466 [Tilletia walkeri]